MPLSGISVRGLGGPADPDTGGKGPVLPVGPGGRIYHGISSCTLCCVQTAVYKTVVCGVSVAETPVVALEWTQRLLGAVCTGFACVSWIYACHRATQIHSASGWPRRHQGTNTEGHPSRTQSWTVPSLGGTSMLHRARLNEQFFDRTKVQ